MKYRWQQLQWFVYRYYLIIFKYRKKDGAPLKCIKCGCKEMIMTDKDYISYALCEYTEKCKQCGHVNGHWAYGSWEPFI